MCDAYSGEIEEITRQKEEQNQYFKMVMDEYMGNIYICDVETYDLLYVNKVACQTLHIPAEEVIGRKCYEMIQGRTSPCPFCTNDKLKYDEFYEWEFYNHALQRTFLIKNRLIHWEGHEARMEMSHDNYSVEYKLEKKDREKEAFLRAVPGGFVRIDARDCRTILWYGADMLGMIGYTKEQFEKELHSTRGYVHPDDEETMINTMKQVKEHKGKATFEARIRRRDGSIRNLTISMCYVPAEESWDCIPSFYSMGIDVTHERMEQKKQRAALEDAYQAARVANSAKTNFLSSMSHDIRTPMNAIMGMAAIARANLDSPDRVRDCLSKINISSQHLLRLINEVLDMSKIESGKIDLIPEEVYLPGLIQEIFDMCRPLLVEKNQELRINAGRIRHERIITDGDRLQQVFMNLLSNCIKYTPEGGRIDLMINEGPSLSENKGHYEFVFSDNGIGMSEEFVQRIFEPFSRAEDPKISKIQGTGLGMAITENIIRMMNGSIEVRSQEGVGSQFTVFVQFETVSEEETADAELSGLPVLVVDDDQPVCENATALLVELGMRGYWVLSGAEAIERVEKAHEEEDDFFAVILDWKMPEMDGLETLKILRKKLGEDIPIIIISAYDFSDIEEEFIHAGADAFISKPLFKSKMLHVLQLFCGNRAVPTSSRTEEDDSPLLGKRLLLAEDNELNQEIVIELLQMQGLVVEAVENGALAVETFANSEPGYYAAILMDIQMPVMNGYAATEHIRRLDREDAKTIPILALTANAFTADIGRAHDVGMNDHIAKPVDIERLMSALKQWIPEASAPKK